MNPWTSDYAYERDRVRTIVSSANMLAGEVNLPSGLPVRVSGLLWHAERVDQRPWKGIIEYLHCPDELGYRAADRPPADVEDT